MIDWQVRRATVDDAASIARIQVEGWRVAYAGLVPEDYLAAMETPERVTQWREWLAAPDPYATFVAVGDADMIGAYCTVGVLPTADGRGEPDAGELMAIYADPAYRGTGAGGAVHDAGVTRLIRLGFPRAGLWVFTANASARAFYAARGWAPDGHTHSVEIAGVTIPEMRYTRTFSNG